MNGVGVTLKIHSPISKLNLYHLLTELGIAFVHTINVKLERELYEAEGPRTKTLTR